jgi:uncharacterized surface protein with fasciclin (FAS1) repeats
MFNMKTIIKTLFVSVIILVTYSCKTDTNKDANNNASENTEIAQDKTKGQAFIKNDGSTPNVLQIAIGSKDHTTLVAAVQAADLENVLVNAGPLMVFAPTNAAFDVDHHQYWHCDRAGFCFIF